MTLKYLKWHQKVGTKQFQNKKKKKKENTSKIVYRNSTDSAASFSPRKTRREKKKKRIEDYFSNSFEEFALNVNKLVIFYKKWK